jgi:hypothetical protein
MRAVTGKLGRHVFGAAAFAAGLITLVWHDYTPQLSDIWKAHGGAVFVYAAAVAQIVGGVAIQFRRTAKAGALVLGAVYLVFAFLCVPAIIATPRTYRSWGDFFYQFALVVGAAMVYRGLTPISRILLGVCFVSFTLEQAIYLDPTAQLVPKGFPPSQMFWAVATTVAFALAALAILANRMALLASRLLTVMIMGFGLLVWVPLVLADPHNPTNRNENVETFAIAGAAWILADLLGATATASPSSRVST